MTVDKEQGVTVTLAAYALEVALVAVVLYLFDLNKTNRRGAIVAQVMLAILMAIFAWFTIVSLVTMMEVSK